MKNIIYCYLVVNSYKKPSGKVRFDLWSWGQGEYSHYPIFRSKGDAEKFARTKREDNYISEILPCEIHLVPINDKGYAEVHNFSPKEKK